METKERNLLVERLAEDLIGPFEVDEVLNSRPSDVYLTGILWPRKTQMGGEDDEKFGFAGDSETDANDVSGAGEEESVSINTMNRPSAAGISCATTANDGKPTLDIKITFGIYKQEEIEEDKETKEKEETEGGSIKGKKKTVSRKVWKRSGIIINIPEIVLTKDTSTSIDLSKRGAFNGAELYIRTAQWKENCLATFTLVNSALPNPDDGRNGIEQLTMFQTRIEVRPCKGTVLIARPSRRAVIDDDDRSDALLYRSAKELAVGHTCSAEWGTDTEHEGASFVATTWIPRVLVPTVSANGHSVFESLRSMDSISPLSTEWLAYATNEQLFNALAELPKAYTEWITLQEKTIADLDASCQIQAKKNMDICRDVAKRMTRGAIIISKDATVAESFRLSNRAMYLQHSWDPEKSGSGPLQWRPFQLGFILLSLPSIIKYDDPDRMVMDLLWFPTGGGKTEAYLALIAFLAFYRRLSNRNRPDDGAGVGAIMRYTLRLLTTQQFVRASAMILACEKIRREYGSDGQSNILGQIPFSIGLWVGGEATPNRIDDAKNSLAGSRDLPSPKQLSGCPACRQELEWQYDSTEEAVSVRCRNEECVLYDKEKSLPVFTVDDDIYRERPTLIIGTVDKFAQVVRRKEIREFFSVDDGFPPDLIIQDELHLISGPLGTVVGMYETAIDRLFSKNGFAPKVIGSTATIRRAPEQVRSLFNRGICQFPPPAIDSSDSGFSVIDTESPGRFYAGVTTAGRSAKFALQAVAASLLQSAFAISGVESVRDPYWTLVLYFNALRELGGALVLMQDDVNDSLKMIAERRKEKQRLPKIIEELTSRRTQLEVKEMLDKLALQIEEDGALDAVLATNMMSVGVDIPRLGLMLVNGQPKGIAEYIQATSRIGRGQVPGLVVAVLNNAKARDRSHYESFATWHGTLYRDVEATSVTPFASRARDRVLHAVLVTLIRHLVPEMLDNPKLDNNSIAAAKKIIKEITRRAQAVDLEETDVEMELERLLDQWNLREPKHYWNQRAPNNSLLQDAERAATLKAMGRLPGSAWPTMNNMRSVEPSSRFRLVNRLRKLD